MNQLNNLAEAIKSRTTLLCVGMAVMTVVVPFARAFFRVEVSYNEGWNIYNASTVAAHPMLYPVKYGWTTVNDPMLSFALMAWLHRLTHEYLFTARAISLASVSGSGALVAVIVRNLGASKRTAMLAGLYCVAMFCADADGYVGMDDPQMLAQVFFLGGLLIYVQWQENVAAIAAAALAFAVGGSIKHKLIDFPLAVFVDLVLVSRVRALEFAFCGICFAAISFGLNVHFGGPEFVSQLLAPRSYSWVKVPEQFLNVFGPRCCFPSLLRFTRRRSYATTRGGGLPRFCW